jgi:hypothetical protein
VNRWGTPAHDGWKLVETYLRAYHGAREVITYCSGEYWYATYDTAEWRAYTGNPDAKPSLDEWRAYCEGEVYDWVIEQRERVLTSSWHISPDGTTREHSSQRDSWENVDACGGYYGYEHAEAAAREHWDAHLADLNGDGNDDSKES